MKTGTKKAKVIKKREVMPDKAAPAGITVILGGKEYEVKPLVIRESREWRKKAAPFQAAIAKYASINSDDPEQFEKALIELLIDRIDETIDLFFDYARELDRKTLEDIATDKEIVEALNRVNKMAFPFGEVPEKAKTKAKHSR